VTRGYAEAERQGLLEARVGSGTYVRQASQADSFRIESTQSDGLDLGFTLALEDNQAASLSQSLRVIADDLPLLRQLTSFVPETGLERHRAAAQEWLSWEGIHRPLEEILLCGGGQNGLFTALHTLCDSGDTVLSEGLTYSGMILAARHLRLRHVGLPLDDEGMLPNDLKIACERYRPRALYLMPQLQNPTGRQMSLQRKQELLDICHHFGVMVIEDNVQSTLLADTSTPMISLMPHQVVGISSCTKCFAGGVRVGFLVPPRAWLDRFRMAMRVNSWMISPIMAEMTARWINHEAQDSLRRQRAKAKQRHDLARQYLTGFDYHAHDHSLSGWLTLPEHWRASEFVRHLGTLDVQIKAADVFAVGQYRAPQAVRICVGAPATEETLRLALGHMRQALPQTSADDSWLWRSTI
ncbi:MAG: PLP-dependent aminotransferase family protein, partial [Natronospirillum sp.]